MTPDLQTRLEAAQARIRHFLEVDEQRGMTPNEVAQFDDATAEAGELLERMDELAEQQARTSRLAAARAGTGRAHITHEPSVYEGRHGGPSFFADLTTLAVRGYDRDAATRMDRHRQERALSTTDGAGGEFVPPAWFVDQAVKFARAARPTADLMQKQALPSGTDSINVPKVATGTAVAEQGTQNTSVQNTDATTTSVTANVATIAGQQVVAVQMIEQSPINVDTLLLQDLAADYAAKLDLAVLSNNATGKKGVLSESGTNAITYTDASPTVPELYSKLADAIQQITTGRFMGPDSIVMHPRRWAWFTAASDTNGRPYVTPSATGSFNAIGTGTAGDGQGPVGALLGLPVYLDPQIPTNLGAGTNEDRIIVGRFSDAVLYESTPRAEAFRETKADQLSVLLRFYNYAAWTFARYPKSYSVVAGTGLTPPAF